MRIVIESFHDETVGPSICRVTRVCNAIDSWIRCAIQRCQVVDAHSVLTVLVTHALVLMGSRHDPYEIVTVMVGKIMVRKLFDSLG